MSLQLILGTSGSGKTTHVFNDMINRVKRDASLELYLVPEQYTMQAQEEFLKKTGQKGLLNIEVLSFNRMVYRFYDQLSLANKTNLSDNGRSLIIRKIIEEHEEDFVWIKKHRKKQTYMEELNTLISECYQYNVDEDKLQTFIDKIDEQLLKDKLKDLQKLLEYFKKEVAEDFMTTGQALEHLIRLIPDLEDLKKTNITIDAFYGFTPVQYKFLQALLAVAPKVTICITIDAREKITDMKNESELFYESKKMISGLKDIVDLLKIEMEAPLVMDSIVREKSEALQHLSNHLFRYPVNPYKGMDKSLRLVEASTLNKECELVARRIFKLIARGKRYIDILVLTSDLSMYESGIKTYFDQYELTYFIDKKETTDHHPLIQFVLSALLILQYNFKYEHVFYHLKSIYYEQNQALMKIENYAYRHGVKSRKRWEESFEEFNDEKLALINKLLSFANQMKKAKTVTDKVKALYHYLEAVKVVEVHDRVLKELEGQLKMQEAVEYVRIYKLLIGLLDDSVNLVGDEKISTKDFAKLIESGISGIKMAQTPPSVDSLIVGDLSRTRFMECDYIFALGFNEGKVPFVVNNMQLLTDEERSTLLDLGLELAPNQAKSLYKEQMNIYMALSKARKMLHISFSRSGQEGLSRPASIFYSLKKMFAEAKVESADESLKDDPFISKPRPMFNRLANIASGDEFWDKEEEIERLYGYFYHKYQESSENGLNPTIFIDGLSYDNKVSERVPLDKTDYTLSVSQLETYASCPYAHFLEYRLGIKAREEYMITLPDIGILFHRCLELYNRKCVYRELDIASIDPQVRNHLIEECIAESLGEVGNKIFSATYRNQYLVVKLTRILKRALWGIEKQLGKSLFRPKDVEYNFDGKKAETESLVLRVSPNMNMFLKGVVDRVDEYESDDFLHLSIIDYKSSDKTLNFGLIDSGIQLQLFVYLNIVKEIKEKNTSKKVIPSGLYYYHIQDPYVKSEEDSPEMIESKLMQKLRLKGLVLHDENIIRMFDQSIKGTSDVVPVTITSKGISARSSSTITEEQMDVTLNFVKEKARSLASSIQKGQLDVSPYIYENQEACEYCKFNSVCRFDTSNKEETFRIIQKQKMEEAIKKWEGVSHGRSDQTDY